MDFRTRYTAHPIPGEEPGGGKRVTESAGYIPAEVQIEEMLLAGKRLGEYRKERYDFAEDEEVPEDFIDPTRAPGLDLAEASMMERSMKERFKILKAELAEKKKAQAEAAAAKPAEN